MTLHLGLSVAGRHHAIPLASVKEVLGLPMIQATEGRPAQVAGLFNLRGAVVEVLDLARLLELPSLHPSPDQALVVLEAGPLALWVEGVEGVLEWEEGASLEAPPSPFLLGLALQDTRLYHLLDWRALVEAPGLSGPPGDPMKGLEDSVREALEVRARAFAEIQAPPLPTQRAVLAFEWNREAYALDLSLIREILPCPPLHPLPGAPAAYRGLVNHRGQALLVLDPRAFLGLPLPAPGPDGRLLVVEDPAHGGRVGLFADAVLRDLDLDARELRPSLVEHGPEEWVEGEWVVEGRPLALLRLEVLLAQPTPA